MRKGLCPKCHNVVLLDENVNEQECPNCHEKILADSAMKAYVRSFTIYKRKAEMAMMQSTDYEDAFKNYKVLLTLKEDSLNALSGVVLSCLYCSNLKKITIREATNYLLKGSDKIEIGKDNITQLSDFLTKVREDCKLIVDTFKKYANQSNYVLNMYHKALDEYIYYLDAYKKIYDGLDKLNAFLKEGKDLLDDEISNAKKALKEEIKVNNPSNDAHPIKDENNNEIIDIFPNKKKIYKITLALFIVMAVGIVLSIVGLVLSTNKNIAPAAKYSVLAIGLVMFIGGYFIRHYFNDKFYKGQRL